MKWWTKPGSAFAGPAVLFLLTITIFWKLTLTNHYTWLDSPDFVNQVLPWFQFEATEWHQGRFPLWDPYHWGGQSLIGQGQPGAAYPFNWILFLLPLRDGRIPFSYLNWYFVLIHYMGALFCYWLCRDLKRSRTASVIAGAAFGLSGYLGAIGWPQMLNGAVWAPLVFLFFLRAMRGHSPWANAALSGAALGFAFLSGHHQIPIFLSLAVGAAWIFYWMKAEMPRRKIIGLAVLFGIFVVLTSGLQILPIYEYGKLALRWVNAAEPVGWDDKVPYSVHREFSLGPLSILGIVIPGINNGFDPFIGIVIVSLAFLGVAAAWHEPMVRFFGAIAVGGLVFSLGANAIFHGVIYALIPMVEKARVPAQAILIFHLGVAVLAAYGFDAYRHQPQHWIWARRVVWALAGVGATLYIGTFALKGFAQDPSTRAALIALLLAALLYAWRRDWLSLRAAGVWLIVLMCFEISGVTGYYFRDLRRPGYFVDRMEETSDIAQFLRRQPFPVRVEMDRDLIAFNWGDWFRIDAFGGYCGVTRNVIEHQSDVAFTDLFAINYYIGPKPSRDGQVEIFRGAGGLKVYRNPSLRPRVWAVHEAVQVVGPKAVTATLLSRDFNPARQTFLTAPPALETCSRPDQVRLLERNPDHLTIEADLGCRGMVIAGETYSPGWLATVDGKPGRIYEVYSALRGVVVDAGRHRVEMRYRPKSVIAGAIMTALGIAGAVVIFFLAI
jgi:Bacterial membrane protein YfhO